jgi:hypothetical protein
MNRREVMTAGAGGVAIAVAGLAPLGEVKAASDQSIVPVSFEPAINFSNRLHEYLIDQELDGNDDPLVLTREMYKGLSIGLLIDHYPDPNEQDATVTKPFFMGRRIKVPGSVFA